MLNLRPQDLGLLDCVVEECDLRFTEEQQEQILGIIAGVLGDAESMDVDEAEETNANGNENGNGRGDGAGWIQTVQAKRYSCHDTASPGYALFSKLRPAAVYIYYPLPLFLSST